MSFSRHLVQMYFEAKVGCTDVSQFKSYKSALETLIFSTADVESLRLLLLQDATSLYLKSLLTFTQALEGIVCKEFAWPIVKMYYSVFYAIRSEFAASGVVVVKCGQLFFTKNEAGASFSKIQNHGDHQTYISLKGKLPVSAIARDSLLDNKIVEDKDVYMWMCDNRERVNYRMKNFTDPEPDEVLDTVYHTYFEHVKLSEMLDAYERDLIFCFDTDHATIAVPYRKLRTCRDLLKGRIVPGSEECAQMEYARNHLKNMKVSDEVVGRLML